MISVPFEIAEVHGGLSEAKGIVLVEDNFVVFQLQMTTLGMFKREPEIIKIEIAAIDEMRLEKRLFSDRLYIRPKRMKLLEVMPGKHGLEVKLKVRKRHRGSALVLVDSVRRRKRI